MTRPASRLTAAVPSWLAPLLLASALASCGTDGGHEHASPAAGEDDGWVTIDISNVHPIPGFNGPVPADLPNLEEMPPEPVFELRLPAGAAENVALGKPVTSSDPDAAQSSLDLVTDGNADDRDGAFVELAPGRQWVQIDLGQEHEIHVIHLWHYHEHAAAYIDVVVQISSQAEFENEDGTTADHVVTVWNADHDGSSGLGLPPGTDPAYVESNHGRVIGVDAASGRHVRLYINGNTRDRYNRFTEVMVYGQPVGED